MPIILFVLPAFVAAGISFALTPLARRLALRVGAVDQPGPRKMHVQPTPRLGGLAVVAAVFIVAGLTQTIGLPGLHTIDASLLRGLALGVLPILVISICDDIRPMPVLPRFLAQFAGATIALLSGIQLGSRIHVFALDLRIGWLAVPISLLWIVGVTNAFNIVDGLDGLSAGLALIAAFSLVGVALMTGRFALASISMILGGALVGFLPFNLFPARIFLGDSGSTAIGFWLACLALRGGSTLSAGMAILVPILVIGVPLAETLISMLRRFVRGIEKRGGGLFAADREHMHHRLVARGITQRRAVILLYSASLAAAGGALVSVFLTTQAAAVLLVTLLAAAVIGITRLNYDEFALVRRGVILRVYDAPVLRRALFPVFFDLGLVVIALYSAIVLKTDDWGLRSNRMLAFQLLEILPIVTLGAFWAMRLYRGSWRNASVADFLRSSSAVLASCALGALFASIAVPNPPPLTLFVIYGLVLLGLVNGSRGSYRFFSHFRRPGASEEGSRVLIYGAGLGGTMALREILSQPELGMHPVGFLDDEPSMTGRVVNGFPVLGSGEDLAEVLAGKRIDSVIVASSKIGADRLREVENGCREAGVRVTRFRIEFVDMDPARILEETGSRA